MQRIYKYPKTYHLKGSGLSNQSKEKVPFSRIASRYLVVEEKVDGTNVAISFDSAGELQLQSRGHFLTGGITESHFSLFKQWAYGLQTELYLVLSDRYILYGEWLYAKHTVFYNALPHYFLEYDVLDTETGSFLSTRKRQSLLQELPIYSVPVLFSGTVESYSEITSLVGQSNYIKPGHLTELTNISKNLNLDPARTLTETDNSETMEGLYIKVEEDGIVKERYKYIREEFIQNILNSGGHWQDRKTIANQLVNNSNPSLN